MVVGNLINFNCHKFVIMQVDEFSRKVAFCLFSLRVILRICRLGHGKHMHMNDTLGMYGIGGNYDVQRINLLNCLVGALVQVLLKIFPDRHDLQKSSDDFGGE